MNLLTSILLGVVQGLTEFLPVSSSGHLAIVQAVVGDVTGQALANPVGFDVLLHLGTLFAVVLVYLREIIALVPALFTLIGKFFRGKRHLSDYTENERLALLLVIATLPLILGAVIEHSFSFLELLQRTLPAIGAILIVNGALLLLSDLLPSRGKSREKSLSEALPRDALLIGCCQLAAVLPGLSRSGSTITGGRLAGLSRESAVKFSFLLSLPAIAGACILNLPDLISGGVASGQIGVYLAGAAAAFVVGLLAIKLLKTLARRASFRAFGIYCILIGAATIVYGVVR